MITHNVLSQYQKPYGVEVATQFHDDDTNTTITKTFRFKTFPTQQELDERIAHAIYHIEFDVNWLNRLNLEGDDRFNEIFVDMIKYVRNHPDCTLNNLKTAAETKYPDMLWKTDKLIEWVKAQLKEYYGFVPTFTQFKNYIQTHKFAGVDG